MTESKSLRMMDKPTCGDHSWMPVVAGMRWTCNGCGGEFFDVSVDGNTTVERRLTAVGQYVATTETGERRANDLAPDHKE